MPLMYGAYSTPSETQSDDLVYDQNGGIGMLDGFVLDAHFR